MAESRGLTRVTRLMLALVILAIVTIWRWQLILSAVASLVLTPIVILFAGGMVSRYVRADLWEYWIAGAVWFITFIVLSKSLIQLVTSRPRERTVPRRYTARWASVGLSSPSAVIIGCFCFLALCAPFLAPFLPDAQGDLMTTRMLKPFEKALVVPSPMPPVRIPADEATGIVGVLERTNDRLLNRREKFTHLIERESDLERAEKVEMKTFLLGTDDLGRDVFSRLVYGARVSVGIGFAATVCTIFLGCMIGFLAGTFGGWVDRILMRLTDLFLAIPSLFLVIALIAFFGSSTFLLIIVLATAGWMSVARLIRGEVLSLREREFILSARLLGRSSIQIVRDHMIPNVLPIIFVASVLQLGNVVLAEAALSFLGLGIQPPTPSWGNMIGESMAYIESGWWVGLFPGIALSLLVVAANLAAERREAKRLLLQ
jgi:peptide/nickel transport system permease protein